MKSWQRCCARRSRKAERAIRERRLFASTTLLACRSTSSPIRCAIKASDSIPRSSSGPWQEQRERRQRFLEGRAQGSRQSRLRQAGGDVSHRAGLLLRHERAGLPHRGHRHAARGPLTNCRRARKAKSCWTARRSMPNPADRSPTSARSGITSTRWSWPRCAARIIPSPD